MATDNLRARVLLSAQRALLGEVFPALESVWLRIELDGVELFWCVDGPLSSEDRESMSSVEAEMQADFDAQFTIESTVLRPFAMQETYRNAAEGGKMAEVMLACAFERRPS